VLPLQSSELQQHGSYRNSSSSSSSGVTLVQRSRVLCQCQDGRHLGAHQAALTVLVLALLLLLELKAVLAMRCSSSSSSISSYYREAL
jgi:hypothetical protein